VFVLPIFDVSHATTVVLLLFCGATLTVLLVGWRAIQQTTLVSAWSWSLAAILGLAGLVVARELLDSSHADSLDALRFAIAALTFCPVISLLGSKRPQHKAWNFIVLSLWVVLTLPGAEMLLLQRGQGLEVNDARGWFLWILLVLLPINFLPTKFWLPAIFATLAQALLLSEYLPLVRQRPAFDLSGAISLITIATLGTLLIERRPNRVADRFDRVWLAFRDTFGLLWGLRVAERVNAAAMQHSLPVELTWQGFRNRTDGSQIVSLGEDEERVLRQALSGLLRRFVTTKWIAERTSSDLD
jgi:hypothetical protein